MIILCIVAFIETAIIFSTIFKKKVIEIYAPLICLLSIVMYFLAMINQLFFIDDILIALMIIESIYVLKKIIFHDLMFLNKIKKVINSPEFILSLVLFGIIIVGLYKFHYGPCDELNYVTPYVKVINGFNGLAGKNQSTNPLFCDYPILVQVFMAWVLHGVPTWSDGAMEVAYYIWAMAFWLLIFQKFSISKKIKKQTQVIYYILFIFVLFVGNMVTLSYYSAITSDYLMGLTYGGALLNILNWEEKKYYRITSIIYLSTMILMKQLGIVLLVFWLSFFVIWNYKKFKENKMKKLETIFFAGIPIFAWSTWKIYCFVMERNLGPSSTMKTIVTEFIKGTYIPNENALKYVKAYIEAFFTISINGNGYLSVFLFIIIIACLISFISFRYAVLDRLQYRKLLVFELSTSIVLYGLILFFHLTIFATETQYVDPNIMIYTISRYGSAYTISSVMIVLNLLISVLLNYQSTVNTICFLGLIIAMIFTTNLKKMYYGLYGYRNELTAVYMEEEQVKEKYQRAISQIMKLDHKEADRVLIFQPEGLKSYEYLYNFCAPISLCYPLSTVMNSYNDLIWNIDATKSSYIYVTGVSNDLLTSVNDTLSGAVEFKEDTLYKITIERPDNTTNMEMWQVELELAGN